MRFSRQRHIVHDRETATAFLSEVERSGGLMVASLSRHSGDLVATVTVRPRPEKQGVEMGILTLKEFHRSGMGLATWQACLDYLRVHESRIRLVMAGTHRDNEGMKRILVSSGFLEVSSRERHGGNSGPIVFYERQLPA